MSSLTSGSRTFSPLIQSMTGLYDVRWTARFAWVRQTDLVNTVTRIPRSKLPNPPEHCSAYDLADAVTANGRVKK